MAAKIKLQRKGTKSRPFYRVIVQDESEARDGKAITVLGKYHPLVKPTLFEVDKEKTLTWISKGAKPTEKVRILLGKAGILPPVDLASLKKKKPKAEQALAEAAPTEEKKEAVKTEEKKEAAKTEEKKEAAAESAA